MVRLADADTLHFPRQTIYVAQILPTQTSLAFSGIIEETKSAITARSQADHPTGAAEILSCAA